MSVKLEINITIKKCTYKFPLIAQLRFFDVMYHFFKQIKSLICNNKLSFGTHAWVNYGFLVNVPQNLTE